MVGRQLYSLVLFLLLISCSIETADIKNEKEGNLKSTHSLVEVKVKKFLLDSDTAPNPQYIQVFVDSTERRNFTFLNIYDNSIYFYDYDTLGLINKTTYDKNGPNGILKPMGYHIKDRDSIFIYDMATATVKIGNAKSEILNSIALRGKEDSKTWYVNYPQYIPKTVTPFIETSEKLLLSGQIMRTVPDTLIDKFKFTAHIDYRNSQVDFYNTYPQSLYGFNYNWEGEIFTEVFTDLHPDGDKLICSFPVSHDLYLTELESGIYRKVYAGSNFVQTIRSVAKDPRKVSRSELILHVIKQNEYAAIKYDKWRKVYYRFLLKGMPDADIHTQYKEKPIAVIMMDEDFKYLGETVLGPWKQWNWHNSFVTKEGLNIEYLDENDIEEVNLSLKILIPKLIE
jgi:hypothetical protein